MIKKILFLISILLGGVCASQENLGFHELPIELLASINRILPPEVNTALTIRFRAKEELEKLKITIRGHEDLSPMQPIEYSQENLIEGTDFELHPSVRLSEGQAGILSFSLEFKKPGSPSVKRILSLPFSTMSATQRQKGHKAPMRFSSKR